MQARIHGKGHGVMTPPSKKPKIFVYFTIFSRKRHFILPISISTIYDTRKTIMCIRPCTDGVHYI